MNAEKIFDVMENIDEQYIIEAHQKNVIKNKKKRLKTNFNLLKSYFVIIFIN